jgi:hypothetical protein
MRNPFVYGEEAADEAFCFRAKSADRADREKPR